MADIADDSLYCDEDSFSEGDMSISATSSSAGERTATQLRATLFLCRLPLH